MVVIEEDSLQHKEKFAELRGELLARLELPEASGGLHAAAAEREILRIIAGIRIFEVCPSGLPTQNRLESVVLAVLWNLLGRSEATSLDDLLDEIRDARRLSLSLCCAYPGWRPSQAFCLSRFE